ncbi:lysophospholipid acyltransferase family protein [Luteimonas terricola]|uniref:Acyltransferase n=1 Tax=Luteimonas terricola TaxID=645597 RepID=A0ABQ2EP81_9GAMM|nr:lysophospholipid acyltransferase family protein [Luteimonas terricola]GGK15895.1 acyltransferase [Luteimonas terricola]
MSGANADILPPLPPQVPRVKRNRFTRWLGRGILRLGGWRVVGEFPDEPRLVLIAAPHSSNWDGIWGFAVKLGLGLDIKLLGKRELFWWPLGPLLRKLGVIAVDRNRSAGVVEQVAAMIRTHDRFWFGLAPEGTRKPVEHWKSGFLKIARAADVPVLPVYFHYPDKVIGIGPLFQAGEDAVEDMRRIREWYRPWQGRNRGTV